MSAQKDGGSAFPLPLGTMNCSEPGESGGMSLRDYFAVHASRQDVEAQAEVIRMKTLAKKGVGVLPDGWQTTARYMHADAMLEARK